MSEEAVSAYETLSEETLSLSDIAKVTKAIDSVAYKWYLVGVQLGVPVHNLEQWKFKQPRQAMQEVISMWLTSANHPTWRALVDVLQSDIVGERKLAKRIAEEYRAGPSRVFPSTTIKQVPPQPRSSSSLSSSLIRPPPHPGSHVGDTWRQLYPLTPSVVADGSEDPTQKLRYTSHFHISTAEQHPVQACFMRERESENEGTSGNFSQDKFSGSSGASTATASAALNLSTVADFLLDLDRSQVYNLGISLELSRGRVKSKFDLPHDTTVFLDDIISAWLQRVDQVDEKGGPSWTTLIAALKSKRLKQTGIASDIERDMLL